MQITECGFVVAKSNRNDGVVFGVKIVARWGNEGVL